MWNASSYNMKLMYEYINVLRRDYLNKGTVHNFMLGLGHGQILSLFNTVDDRSTSMCKLRCRELYRKTPTSNPVEVASLSFLPMSLQKQ